jgi:hypothetical protein
MFPIRLVNPKRAWDEGKKTETGVRPAHYRLLHWERVGVRA